MKITKMDITKEVFKVSDKKEILYFCNDGFHKQPLSEFDMTSMRGTPYKIKEYRIFEYNHENGNIEKLALPIDQLGLFRLLNTISKDEIVLLKLMSYNEGKQDGWKETINWFYKLPWWKRLFRRIG